MELKIFVDSKYTTNTYLILTDKTILIDPAQNYEAAKKYAASLNRSIDLVLITHGHYDHIGDLNMVIHDNIPIYIDPDDLILLDSNQRGGCAALKIKPFATYKGNFFNINIIKSPGHTLGSVMYQIENWLFSGDTLFKQDVGRVDLFNSDPIKMQETIQMILKMKNYTVYPGHEGKTTIDQEKTNLRNYLLKV